MVHITKANSRIKKTGCSIRSTANTSKTHQTMLDKILGSIVIIIALIVACVTAFDEGYRIGATSRTYEKGYQQGYKNAEIMLETKRLEDSIKNTRNATINSRR